MKKLRKKIEMESLKKTTMKQTFNNHNGCLLEGERVLIIQIKEDTGEVKVTDPFDREWIVPILYVNLD